MIVLKKSMDSERVKRGIVDCVEEHLVGTVQMLSREQSCRKIDP